MVFTGQQADAGRIPGERIETSIETSESSDFTDTQTTLHSIMASLVEGRTYRVSWYGSIRGDASGDVVDLGINEDDGVGTEIQTDRVHIASTTSFGFGFHVEVEFTAASTGNKTFVGHARRLTGTGVLRYAAASARPRYMYVDYIRG